MKKYEYVKVHFDGIFSAELEEHRNIIDQYAAKGYRYVGYIPVYIDMDGKMKDIDLIFEIDC